MKDVLNVDEIGLAELLSLRDSGAAEYVHNCFKESKLWRANYRSLTNNIPESLTWYKDKKLTSPVVADSVDAIIYYSPHDFSTVIMFRTKDAGKWKSIKSSAEASIGQKEHVSENGVELFIYFDDKHYIKMANAGDLYSMVVMNKSDYDKGLNIE